MNYAINLFLNHRDCCSLSRRVFLLSGRHSKKTNGTASSKLIIYCRIQIAWRRKAIFSPRKWWWWGRNRRGRCCCVSETREHHFFSVDTDNHRAGLVWGCNKQDFLCDFFCFVLLFVSFFGIQRSITSHFLSPARSSWALQRRRCRYVTRRSGKTGNIHMIYFSSCLGRRRRRYLI